MKLWVNLRVKIMRQ